MATSTKTTGKKIVKTRAKTKRVEQRVSSPKKRTTKTPARAEQRVAATTSARAAKPKKTTRKRTVEADFAELELSESAPKSRVISRKYIYAVLIVLAILGLLFAASRMWVVAWVDNKPITKFELYSLLEKRDGGKTTEELIQEKLLESEGQKQRQTVSDAEIEAEMKKVEDAQGGAAQLDQILAMNRLSREDFRKLVSLNLLKQKLFGQGINITNEDINKYIEENKDSLPPGIMDNPQSSEAAQLRESAREQLKQMRVNENFNKWLEEAMNGPRVSRNAPAPTQPAVQQITPQ